MEKELTQKQKEQLRINPGDRDIIMSGNLEGDNTMITMTLADIKNYLKAKYSTKTQKKQEKITSVSVIVDGVLVSMDYNTYKKYYQQKNSTTTQKL